VNKAIPAKLVEEPAPQRLYAAQAKVYPREIDGRFARLRTSAVFVLLGVFYALPWLRWDGHQAVLFDLPARKFHVLGLTFWPQDFFWLAWLLIIAALSLFFFTALAGRLWCGYACPQTVWTEVFLAIERAFEGRRNERVKLDAGAWTRAKILRKGGKQAVWIVFALWTGFTFVGFFTPIVELAREVPAATLGGWEAFWIVFYALATYGNAGFLREQVCKYMCPYARFQSAMFDQDTLVISYDAARGDPRGARKKSADPRALGLGDCVDCAACVQVCPTGIDIRDGLQIECIACAACVDACDAVMDRLNYRRGLIRYTTANVVAGKPRRILRTRTLVYGSVLAVLLTTFAWGVAHRAPVIVEILRDRNALYRESPAGDFENSYAVKLVNKTDRAQRYVLSLPEGAPERIVSNTTVEVAAGAIGNVPLTLRLARSAGSRGMHAVTLRVGTAQTRELAVQNTQFYRPEVP